MQVPSLSIELEKYLLNFDYCPAAVPSPSGSNNLRQEKSKGGLFSPKNICLSGLNKALPLF